MWIWIGKDPTLQYVYSSDSSDLSPKDSMAIYLHCCFRCTVPARTYQQALGHLVCKLIYKCMFSLIHILLRKENQKQFEFIWNGQWHILTDFYLTSFLSKCIFSSSCFFFSLIMFHFNMNIHLRICFWGAQLETCAIPFGFFLNKLTWTNFEGSWGSEKWKRINISPYVLEYFCSHIMYLLWSF